MTTLLTRDTSVLKGGLCFDIYTYFIFRFNILLFSPGMRTPEQLLVPRLNSIEERLAKMEEDLSEIESPDLSEIEKKFVSKAEVGSMATVKAMDAVDKAVGKAVLAVDKLKKDLSSLTTSVTKMEKRVDALDAAAAAAAAPGAVADRYYDEPSSGGNSSTKRPHDNVSGPSHGIIRPRYNDSPYGLSVLPPPPFAVPDTWQTIRDPGTGQPYYRNTTTGVTTWQNPYGGGMAGPPAMPMPPIAPQLPAGININNENNTTNNITATVGFSPQTMEIYRLHSSGHLSNAELEQQIQARNVMKEKLGINKK